MTTYTHSDLQTTGHVIGDDRFRELISIHFDPTWGAPFWIDRARSLGISPLKDLRCLDDLVLFGDLEVCQLQARPLPDYLPRRFHDRINDLILGQTGGTTGPGTWTAYRDDEFENAFVEPFMLAANHVGFPRNERWLFIGPSGPHIIAKAAPRLARRMASPEPFSVDFDPRWAGKLANGSTARQRYAQHVVDQAMQVIRGQNVGVLFSTPPVLERLAKQMTEAQRLRIRGVHYGGVALDPALLYVLQAQSFPNAVHLAGYGNTLLGCCLELHTDAGRTPAYFPYGDRLLFETIDGQGQPASSGVSGRLRVTRLDETMLIVRLIERDAATLIAPPANAPSGFVLPGVVNPIPHKHEGKQAAGIGLY